MWDPALGCSRRKQARPASYPRGQYTREHRGTTFTTYAKPQEIYPIAKTIEAAYAPQRQHHPEMLTPWGRTRGNTRNRHKTLKYTSMYFLSAKSMLHTRHINMRTQSTASRASTNWVTLPTRIRSNAEENCCRCIHTSMRSGADRQGTHHISPHGQHHPQV